MGVMHCWQLMGVPMRGRAAQLPRVAVRARVQNGGGDEHQGRAQTAGDSAAAAAAACGGAYR